MQSTRTTSWRFLFSILGLALILSPSIAQAGKLISPRQASRHGLVRAWFAVTDIDPSRGRLARVLVDGDSIYALTDRGTVHAMNAENGATQWITRVGNPDYPSMGPTANAKYVAVINGSTLYVLDRTHGTVLWERRLSGGPGAGPALTEEYVYVPFINGKIEGFVLNDIKKHSWVYQSVGRALVQPSTSKYSVFWPTDRGYLYVSHADAPGAQFRIETRAEISTRPAYLEPLVFAVSHDGYVYAADETTGRQRWRYSLGDPISETPAALRGRLYVCSERPRMYCFSAGDGAVQWETPAIARFVAASEDRVYGTDRFYRLHILDQETGERLGMLDTSSASIPIVNEQTDRIYLATPTGLIQCLHEQNRPKPLVHAKAATKADAAGGETEHDVEEAATDTAEEDPTAEDPFGGDDDEKDPFG